MFQDNYSYNVFINCPFDNEYLGLRNALVFAIYDCGFTPRCALEENNSANVRVDKIKKLIEHSQFGVHDISRIELDSKTNLPRFNMPLELGVFLGAMYFGNKKQKDKNCLILDNISHRYQAFISDIAGQDIRWHSNSSEKLITHVRDWLNDSAKSIKIMPGGKEISRRFYQFEKKLPIMCKQLKIELTFTFIQSFFS
ncbi:MAG TPA: hypothetical protein VLI69_03855 [Gammaproteobacteria bacterium]|nr:hypothetical protein [Gammaproteobacteria bacterium]